MTKGRKLADIQTRCEAATPGPWQAGAYDPYRDRAAVYQTADLAKGQLILAVATRLYFHEVRARDADFIEYARSDIPTLLAEVVNLRDALQAAEAEVARLRERIGAILLALRQAGGRRARGVCWRTRCALA